MKTNLSIDLDDEAIKKEALGYARAGVTKALARAFHQRWHTHPGSNDKDGPAQALIEDRIETMLLCEDFTEKIDAVIKENFDTLLEQATLKALDHAIRREVFPRIKQLMAGKINQANQA